jgi:hypothetical protein
MKLSPEFEEFSNELSRDFSIGTADRLMKRVSLESYELRERLMVAAEKAGLSTKEGRALLASARDAGTLGLKHWVAAGFQKADQGQPRRPGRPSGEDWSLRRREAARALRARLESQ